MENTIESKMAEVHGLLGRTTLSKNEEWMFFNYWNKPDYEFLKDNLGKLHVHKIGS